jgi:hypothetical protein
VGIRADRAATSYTEHPLARDETSPANIANWEPSEERSDRIDAQGER